LFSPGLRPPAETFGKSTAAASQTQRDLHLTAQPSTFLIFRGNGARTSTARLKNPGTTPGGGGGGKQRRAAEETYKCRRSRRLLYQGRLRQSPDPPPAAEEPMQMIPQSSHFILPRLSHRWYYAKHSHLPSRQKSPNTNGQLSPRDLARRRRRDHFAIEFER